MCLSTKGNLSKSNSEWQSFQREYCWHHAKFQINDISLNPLHFQTSKDSDYSLILIAKDQHNPSWTRNPTKVSCKLCEAKPIGLRAMPEWGICNSALHAIIPRAKMGWASEGLWPTWHAKHMNACSLRVRCSSMEVSCISWKQQRKEVIPAGSDLFLLF